MEVLQLLGGGAAQQLVDEQVLAGQLVDDAESLGILGICAGKAVENKHILALQIGDDLGADGVKSSFFDGAVHLAPGNIVMNSRGVHDKLIVGAAARIFAGLDHQRAGIGQRALAAAQRVLGELCRRKVAIYRFCIDNAQLFKSVSFHLRDLLFEIHRVKFIGALVFTR